MTPVQLAQQILSRLGELRAGKLPAERRTVPLEDLEQLARDYLSADTARRVRTLKGSLSLRRVGLHAAADQLDAALDDLAGLASALDNESRSTFAALRAGKEVPK